MSGGLAQASGNAQEEPSPMRPSEGVSFPVAAAVPSVDDDHVPSEQEKYTSEDKIAEPTATSQDRKRVPVHQTPKDKNDTTVVVHYEEGDNPMNELLRLAGGQGTHVIVEAIAAESKAQRAGVKPGHALVAINGHSEFRQLPGWQIRLLLEAPVTLRFDSSPLTPMALRCTEIRLQHASEKLGMAPRAAICGPNDKSVLAEEVVFMPGSAPVWLTAKGSNSIASQPQEHDEIDQAPRLQKPSRIYELRRPQAAAIVGRAVRDARHQVGPISTTDEYIPSAPSRPPRRTVNRSPSPLGFCAPECIGECVADDEVVISRNTKLVWPEFLMHDPNKNQAGYAAGQGMNVSRNMSRNISRNAVGAASPGSPRSPRRKAGFEKMIEPKATGGGGDPECPELQPPARLPFSSIQPAMAQNPEQTRAATVYPDAKQQSPPGDAGDDLDHIPKWLSPVLKPLIQTFSPRRSPRRGETECHRQCLPKRA